MGSFKMDKRIDNLIKNWQKRNISGFYCDNKSEAIDKILKIIPVSSSIGFSGSVTLEQLDAVKRLEARGSRVFNPYKAGMSREESLELRKQGMSADYYLASPNAVSEKGELVFFSAYGNRTSGISYAKNVIVVAGINKITPNTQEALKRSREYATPLNCKRLKWNTPCFEDGICRQEICLFPEYKRMCCQILIIEAEVTPDRLKVILVGENLGF
ncbi:MAG: lactate utilization protein [Candidatus Omnitrophota bacterium]|nr:lactate utilization protein [Candidatus Omnitrophota bacterium]